MLSLCTLISCRKNDSKQEFSHKRRAWVEKIKTQQAHVLRVNCGGRRVRGKQQRTVPAAGAWAGTDLLIRMFIGRRASDRAQKNVQFFLALPPRAVKSVV
jgi:hypothetical protein